MKEKDKKTIHVPNLRFPEFQGEWVETLLGSLGDFMGGGTPSSSNTDFWQGNIPWISSSDIKEHDVTSINVTRYINQEAVENSATKLCPAPVLLIVSRVGVGKVAYSKESLCTSQDFTNITNLKCDGLFLSYLLSSIMKLKAKETQGTSIKGITSAEIKSTKLHLPTINEQEKITKFLSLIDDRISTQSKIIEELKVLKASLSKQIFSRKLRFKDENGNDFPEWEEKELGDCLDYMQPTQYIVRNTDYDDKYKIPVLTAGKSFILGYTNEQNDIYEENLPVIIFDDFTTATQFVDFPFKIKSSAMKILIAKEAIDIKFMYEYMNNIKYEIGGHERHWISKFCPMKLDLPSLFEQKKNANFLSSIDSKIGVEAKTHKRLTRQKQYLIQQMFI